MILTFFPDWTKEQIAEVAYERLVERIEKYGLSENLLRYKNRAIINYLRHEWTDYDLDPTPERYEEALKAIGEHYAWLKETCENDLYHHEIKGLKFYDSPGSQTKSVLCYTTSTAHNKLGTHNV